jgi:hypothetical protein
VQNEREHTGHVCSHSFFHANDWGDAAGVGTCPTNMSARDTAAGHDWGWELLVNGWAQVQTRITGVTGACSPLHNVDSWGGRSHDRATGDEDCVGGYTSASKHEHEHTSRCARVHFCT